jgi:hypothetical protein
MKNIIFILIFLFQFFPVYSQVTDSISIIAIDNLGNKDTVIFGFAIAATTGIDNVLGEQDIFSEPLGDLDLRFIQRTTTTMDSIWLVGCNTTGNVKTFDENIDVKKDFRSNNGLLNDHFILSIYGKNYPITLKVLEINFDYDIPYCLYDENSNVVSGGELRRLVDRFQKDTIAYIENSEQCRFIGFRPWVVLKTTKQVKSESFKLFPNPASNYVKLQFATSAKKEIYVIDIMGNIVNTISVQGFDYHLDISNYPPGEYLVNNKTTSLKFIKK